MIGPTQSTVVVFGAPDGTGSMKMMHSYVAAMADADHDVTLVHGDSIRGGAEPIPSAGRTLLDDLASRGVELVETDTFHAGGDVQLIRELRSVCASLDAQTLIAFHQTDRAPVVVAASSSSGVSSLLCIQNLHTFHGPVPIQKAKELAYRAAVNRADLVVASSPAVEVELIERFGLTAGEIVVIPNAIDVENFPAPTAGARDRIRAELGVEPNELMALNVGRLDPQKGHEVLIEAVEIANLEKVKTFVAGGASAGSTSDDYVERLHARLERSPASNALTFLGWRDDIRDLLAASDIYVHPSIWEGWPLAALEGMAASRPVVLSDCVGRPEGFVDGVHGEVVPVSDAAAFASAMARVASLAADERLEMGEAARALALVHYDIKSASRKFLDALEGMTA